MSQSELSGRFIARHLSTYGLNGTNTSKNPPAGFPTATKAPTQFFSIGDHFKFGYNGEPFGFRKSSTCMYWTQYASPRRPLLSFPEELKKAAVEIARSSKNLGFVYTGSPYSRLVLSALASTSEAVRVVLPVDGEGRYRGLEKNLAEDLSGISGHRCVVESQNFSWSDFEQFLERSSAELRCVDPVIAFSVFIGAMTKADFVYEAHWPRVVDQNIDRIEKRSVGPVNWCLEDRESDTEAARHMMARGTSGWPNFLLATPEIYPSLFKSLLGEKIDDVAALQACALSFLDLDSSDPEEWTHLSQRLASYAPMLESRSPKAREVWLTPMDRLMAKWNLDPFDVASRNAEVYGTVF